MTATSPKSARTKRDEIVCRECGGTGFDREHPIACLMCNGAKVITWEVYEERCATVQQLASEVRDLSAKVERLRARLKSARDANADMNGAVDDYVATLARQLRAESAAL